MMLWGVCPRRSDWGGARDGAMPRFLLGWKRDCLIGRPGRRFDPIRPKGGPDEIWQQASLREACEAAHSEKEAEAIRLAHGHARRLRAGRVRRSGTCPEGAAADVQREL